MSTRKSTRQKKVPDRYTPPLNDKNSTKNASLGQFENEHENDSKTNKTSSNKSTSSRTSQLRIELEKLEEISRLEKESELKEIERQKRLDEMERQKRLDEMERQKKLDEMERQKRLDEIERQKRLDEMEQQKRELERQRKMEQRELERQKRLLEIRAELKSASVSSRHDSSSEVNSSISFNDNLDDESQNKVEKWLNDKEQTSIVQMSSPAIVSSAVEQLADVFRKAINSNKPNSNSLRQYLPTFGGKPEDWPLFYSTYVQTKDSFSEEDNLIRLRSSLEGDASKMVKPLFISGKNVSAIIKTLQMRFGRPELILESMQNKTRMLPLVKEEDINGLIEFTTNVLNFTTTAESLSMENYMTNPQLLMELLDKLPHSLKYNWAIHVKSLSLNKPDLKDFSSWLEDQCSIMSIYFRPQPDISTRKRSDTKPVLTNSSNNDKSYKNKWCCVFCSEKHESIQCKIFRKADVAERWKMVAERKLCFYCFGQHPIKFCKNKKACGINNCKLFHSRLLHMENSEKSSTYKKGADSCTVGTKEINGQHTAENVTKSVLLRVCPVTLYGPKCQIDTYALLDDGSTISLLDSATADMLGVEGKVEPLTTCWSNSTCHFDSQSRKVSLKIKGLYENEVFTLDNVRTQSPLDLPHQNVDTVKLREKWSHLNSIHQPLPTAHSKPTILIGQDNVNLILTRKIIEGPTNAPVLSWSYLGWTMHGKCAKFHDRVDDNFTLTAFEYDKLHAMVKESFQTDNYGETVFNETEECLKEDKRAISILENTTRKIGDRYETGLLWKTDEFKYPPSYNNAFKRLKTIEKRMDKDAIFRQTYIEKIEDYVQKGYVRKLTKEEANIVTDRTFYLPHFGVTNPNKPGKFRLVFDAASKANGVSFNDGLLSGPDYLNPLPSVLLKFRLGKYAIVGDIKEMFHQVLIRDEDVDAQRFLWRSGKQKQEPDIYVMKAMTFGSTCSPSSALYVVNHNARQFETTYPEASRSILTKEYMDDLLDSTNSEEEARKRILEITEIHKAGGFQMGNWLSNSKDVLRDVPEELKSTTAKRLKSDSNLPTERVLGMWWNAETDHFDFHHSTKKIHISETLYPTKREILRAAMSLFDPLGFICPTTIKGRLLVQDVWRVKTTWDEVVPQDLCEKWESWLEEVKVLQTFKIPRCYLSNPTQGEFSLHTFVDASQEAFATVVYLVQQTNDSYETMIVASRAKVAPLKPTTIPRLELQAAVLGCRLSKTVEKDIGISISSRIFWSDSVTVLHWIKSEPKIYKQFVSNRIGEIQKLSKFEEWKWVPSKQNPADLATRSNKKFNENLHQEWIRGPDFLTLGTKYWPQQPPTLRPNEEKEIKIQYTGVHEAMQPIALIEIEKFSSWQKLKRTLAWVLRFNNILQQRIRTVCNKHLQVKPIEYNRIPELQPKEIDVAEQVLLKIAQGESFNDEKNLLLHGRPLPKSSRIYSLCPFFEKSTGIIRISARTSNAPYFGPDQKHPILLDGKHHVTKLIIKFHHETCFHQGTETVINNIRKRFWVTNLRCAVKRVKHTCMKCKINNARPTPPQMAPLPEVRVSRVEHPFYYTGVDYFGPIQVTVGRRHEKRYGVIFTCLSTRAVHLEVAHSLTTESCIMAIQRFVSRRPYPSEMFSDNGTNFVAAEKELQTAVKTLDHVQIQRSTSINGIKWNFIPPCAPHMGGCWERLVRSVKTALRCTMQSQYPRDEEFQTLLVKIEFILNSRPLTHSSMDPQDAEPLTPNHFLREGFKVPIVEDQLCKKQLTRVKSLLDGFWKRWIQEYLPCLTKRCKWHKQTKPPKIGDLAIMVDPNNSRNTWPLGRVTAVYEGKDGQIRVVDITTSYGTFKRPLTRVAVLS